MAVKLDIPYRTTIDLPASQAQVFARLRDTPRHLVEFFPGLKHLRPSPSGASHFEWDFGTFKIGAKEVPLKFLTELRQTEPKAISFHPIRKAGYASLFADWQILSTSAAASKVQFAARLQHEVDLPFLLRAVAAPVAEKEIQQLFERYFANVKQNFK